MENKGYNLYKVKGSKFYFVKGRSRKVKYFIEYGTIKDTEYERINKDSGWRIYNENQFVLGNTIWGKEVKDKNDEVFVDKVQMKKALIINLALSIIMWIFIGVDYFENEFNSLIFVDILRG